MFLELEVDCVRKIEEAMRSTDRSPWRGEVERELRESGEYRSGTISARGFVTRNYKDPNSDLVWSVDYSRSGTGYVVKRVEVREPGRKTVVPDLKAESEGRVSDFLKPYDMSDDFRVDGRRVYVANCARTHLLTLVPGVAVLEPAQPVVVKDEGEIAQLVEGLLLSFAPEFETPKLAPVASMQAGIARAGAAYGRRGGDRRYAVA